MNGADSSKLDSPTRAVTARPSDTPTEADRERTLAKSKLSAAFVRLLRPFDFRRVDECKRVIDWLDPRAGDRVLDIGCGDGFYDRRMASRGARVDAIDANPRRVARARRWNPHPHIKYHHMPAHDLTFDDQSFDKVVSICVLEHIPDDARALREMYRVLRPGGRLVLSCDSLSNVGISDRLRRRHAKRYAVEHFYTANSLSGLLRSTGFEPLRAEFVLTTPVSLAITRVTYVADDVGRFPGGWILKYPVLAVAGTLGLMVSRISERLQPRGDAGLTLIMEAMRRG